MKRSTFNLLIIIVFVLITGFSIKESFWTGFMNCTGSPGDNYQTCVSCHWGTLTNVNGYFVTDIPQIGYVPGDTYTITFNLREEYFMIPDFEITAESDNNVKQGFFSALSTSGYYSESFEQKNLSGIYLTDTIQQVRWVAPEDTAILHLVFYASVNYGMMESRLCSLDVWQYPLHAETELGNEFFPLYYNNTEKVMISGNDLNGSRFYFFRSNGQFVFSSVPVNNRIELPENINNCVLIYKVSGSKTRISGKIMIY